MRATFEKIVPPSDASFKLMTFESRVFSAPWHFHPELELTWIMRSRGMRLAGDSVEGFTEGDLVLLGANVPHCWLNSTNDAPGGAQSMVLQFREDAFGALFLDLPETRGVRQLFTRCRRALKFTGDARDDLTTRMQALESAQGLKRIILLLDLLEALTRAAEDAIPLATDGFVPDLNHADGARIDKLIRFVELNYGRAITLAEAADLAHMSPSAFSRYFRAKIGKTFVRFVNELRVSHACRLLIEGEPSITEICFACGFENVSNFNRRFRQIRGTSPSQFRRTARV